MVLSPTQIVLSKAECTSSLIFRARDAFVEENQAELSFGSTQIAPRTRAERATQGCRVCCVPSDQKSRVHLARSIARVTRAVARDPRVNRSSGHRGRRDGFRFRLHGERRMRRIAATHGAPRARRARHRAGAARRSEPPRDAEGVSRLPFRPPTPRRPRSRHGEARETTP